MFKRRNPDRPRDDMASRALAKLREAEADNLAAKEAYEEGRALEAEGEDEAAFEAYTRCIEAWARRHEASGHSVPHEPYERMAILLRRAKNPHAEVAVLQTYLSMAGRDVYFKLGHRLERAQELAEELDAVEQDDEF